MTGLAKWLKDKLGNIIVPYTLTSCVFDADGNSIESSFAKKTEIPSVDAEFSDESENTVQNKAITAEFEKINGMLNYGEDWAVSHKCEPCGTSEGRTVYRYIHNENITANMGYTTIPVARLCSNTIESGEYIVKIIRSYLIGNEDGIFYNYNRIKRVQPINSTEDNHTEYIDVGLESISSDTKICLVVEFVLEHI